MLKPEKTETIEHYMFAIMYPKLRHFIQKVKNIENEMLHSNHI